jgi:Raf kinase inhibitor-like YbhB/YbcL family protein
LPEVVSSICSIQPNTISRADYRIWWRNVEHGIGVDAFTAKQIIKTPRTSHILVFPRGIDGVVGMAGMAITVGDLEAQEMGNPNQGLRLAHTLCAECHLVDKLPGQQSPNLIAPTFEHIANTPGMNSAAAMAMTLHSPAFQQNGRIPSKYTCEGEDASPLLAWEDVPNGAKSLVLIIDDPDAPDPKAPKMVWVHWVVYNIPPDTKGLPENAGKAGLPQGALVGINDFKKTGYGGPCPPIGRHRYFHKLYALDITFDLRGATKAQIERAMQGHVLANAELIGTYQKGDR